MTEQILLTLYLGVAFVLAPMMLNEFFLNSSAYYRRLHAIVLGLLLVAAIFELQFLTLSWALFCVGGFLLYLKKNFRSVLTSLGLACSIPFVFSLISAVWFVSGVLDLHLLGYSREWSFYAALHGAFLGCLFVGCLAHLAQVNENRIFKLGCYLSLIFFLMVAFGINGVPYIKRIGVVGFSLLVPSMIALYFLSLDRSSMRSRSLSALSFIAIIASMTLALMNEFWPGLPRVAYGIPIMVLAHGSLNAIVALPSFYLAVKLNKSSE